MSDTLLAKWHLQAQGDFITPVIPDGCRDLIFKHPAGERPLWFLSALSGCTYGVALGKGDIFIGYRLKPGTRIDGAGLVAAVSGKELEHEDVISRLENYTLLPERLKDALDCLASGIGNVAAAASLLGVSQRSLQRLVLRGTGQPPVYWLQLARVRRAGRAVQVAGMLAEIAFDCGYSDQSHMNRELMRWLGASPLALRAGAKQGGLLFEPGFD